MMQKQKTIKDFFASLTTQTGFVYQLGVTNSFKKDIKSCYKQNLDLSILEDVICKLAKGETLDRKYRVHQLLAIQLSQMKR